jgi:putative oxidoreductase
MDAALLILRVTVGVLVAGHGAQKIFGWFGGSGLGQFSGWLGSMGYRPPRLWGWLGALGEFGGGVLFALGFLSPLGSLGIAASMLTAIAVAHWPKVWNTEHGFEHPLTNLAVALAVGMTGPGAYSLDAVLGTALPSSAGVVGVIVVLVGWLVGLTMWASRPPQPHKA